MFLGKTHFSVRSSEQGSPEKEDERNGEDNTIYRSGHTTKARTQALTLELVAVCIFIGSWNTTCSFETRLLKFRHFIWVIGFISFRIEPSPIIFGPNGRVSSALKLSPTNNFWVKIQKISSKFISILPFAFIHLCPIIFVGSQFVAQAQVIWSLGPMNPIQWIYR